MTPFSPRQMAMFSALLWGMGSMVGLLILVLPHGRGANPLGWAGLTLFAAAVALWTAVWGAEAPMWANYVLSVLALSAVNLAVLFSHHDPVAFAVASLFVLSTIFTASFYSFRAFLIYLVAQIVSSGFVLMHSGIPGAASGWAAIAGTTTTLGIVVHVLQKALAIAAATDPLTGLANRRALEPVIDREIARCARLGHPLCLAVIDLDDFKQVNDSHGHQEGDRLLADLSQAWMRELRATDMLARAGGDEFVLLLPSTAADQALDVLGRLCQSTPQPFSAGVAVAMPGATVEDVMRQADSACYQAKQIGGGQVVVADLAAA
ncbi:MAG: GGDEF domain-containing protein [Acidimicrobiales bacterium]